MSVTQNSANVSNPITSSVLETAAIISEESYSCRDVTWGTFYINYTQSTYTPQMFESRN